MADAILKVEKAVIMADGPKVMPCFNSTEALETYRQDAARIDLVLADMSMPVMNGAGLIYRSKPLISLSHTTRYDRSPFKLRIILGC